MTPGARVTAAIEVFDRWVDGADGLDRVLAAWGRGARYAGSGDRRAVADLVYGAVRRLRSALWVAGAPDLSERPPTHPVPKGRAALLGALRLDGADPAVLFSGAGHAPAPLSEREAEGRAFERACPAVQLDVPDWLMEAGLLGDVPPAALQRLRVRAPVHLRVNRLKADPDTAAAVLRNDGVETVPGPLSSTCLTAVAGAQRVAQSRAFSDGWVEVQDAASQAVADWCAAQPGETVLDLCAGGGGKALALAPHMGGSGRLIAHDASASRLAQIAPRATRAGARIDVRAPGALDDLRSRCDLVLVDAPCSGSGAWARNPDAKWRLTPARLDALTQAQDALMRQAVDCLRPGGRLVYATCSLMPRENGARCAALLASGAPVTAGPRHEWTPLDGGDGFFAATLVRSA